jgi:hypothetical protein
VVLVGLAAHEGVDPERVRADVESDRRLQLLLPRQREREDAVGDLAVLDVELGEVVADHLRRGGLGGGRLRVHRGHDTASSIAPREAR